MSDTERKISGLGGCSCLYRSQRIGVIAVSTGTTVDISVGLEYLATRAAIVIKSSIGSTLKKIKNIYIS